MLSPIAAHVAATFCAGKILGTFVGAARRRDGTLEKLENMKVARRIVPR